MRQWFVYKTIDSRDMGLYISQMPEIVRPAERIEYMNIPGRAGSLSFREGVDVFDGYERSITVYHKREQPLNAVLEWLRGEGDLILSNEPDRVYSADLAAEIRFAASNNDWEQATISFYCQPYKRQFPPELPQTMTTSLTLWNPGNAPSKPLFALPALVGESAQLTVNGVVYDFFGGEISVDCESETVYTDDGLAMDSMDIGEGFPELQPGQNVIEANGFDGDITITPRWRWL